MRLMVVAVRVDNNNNNNNFFIVSRSYILFCIVSIITEYSDTGHSQ